MSYKQKYSKDNRVLWEADGERVAFLTKEPERAFLERGRLSGDLKEGHVDECVHICKPLGIDLTYYACNISAISPCGKAFQTGLSGEKTAKAGECSAASLEGNQHG